MEQYPGILISTCFNCSRILCSKDGKPSIELLEQLLSDPGIDSAVSPTAWRKAVKDKCAICLYLYQTVQASPELTKYDKFRIADEVEEPPGQKDGILSELNGEIACRERFDYGNEEEPLIINFHASTKSEATSYPSKKPTDRGPFDIVELHVAPLGAIERWEQCTPLDVFAMPCKFRFRSISHRASETILPTG